MKRKTIFTAAFAAVALAASLFTTGTANAQTPPPGNAAVESFHLTQAGMQELMASGDPAYSFTLIDSAGNSRPLNLVDGVVTAPAEEGKYKLYASYTEYGTTYYSNGVDFTVKKPDPYWFYFGDTKTLVLKSGPDVPAGYGATVTGSGKIPNVIKSISSDSIGGWEVYRPEMVKAVVADEISTPENMSSWFFNAKNLTTLEGFERLDISNVTDMKFMFFGCTALEDISYLAEWNTGNVTVMNSMFSGCTALENISGLADWDTKNVTDMNSMFSGCTALEDISGLADWDTGNVKRMYSMFSGCTALDDISPLTDWNTGNVTDMNSMFSYCSSLENISGLAAWDTGNVTDMTFMFYECTALDDISPLTDWNTGNVTNMKSMFSGCSKVTNWTTLNKWDVSKVINHSSTFYNCKDPLPSWADTSWQ